MKYANYETVPFLLGMILPLKLPMEVLGKISSTFISKKKLTSIFQSFLAPNSIFLQPGHPYNLKNTEFYLE